MNWCPLDDSKIENISKLIDYSGKDMGASELYRKVADIPYCMKDKVKFILHHWGWDGTLREESYLPLSQISSVGFTIPSSTSTFFHQMYGLVIPMKKIKENESKNNGGTIRFHYPEIGWKDVLIASECLSAKFNETIIYVGDMIDYNGFTHSNGQTWEKLDCKTSGWSYEIYIGNSGRVYTWDTETSDCIWIEAEDILSFFASVFGLTLDSSRVYGYTSDVDLDIMDKIENLWRQGIYKQNYFRPEK